MTTNTTTETVPAAARHLVSYKDLVIAFSNGGVDSVRAQVAKAAPSREVHNKAILHLDTAGNPNVGTYRQYVEELFPAGAGRVPGQGGGGQRGRAAATVGMHRLYLAQQTADSGTFLRLPLESLGVAKGAPVKVSFEHGAILVVVPSDEESQAELARLATTKATNAAKKTASATATPAEQG